MAKERQIPAASSPERGIDVRMLRARLMGLWAARQLGLEGDAADQYASEVIATQNQLGRHGITAKILRDAARQDVGLSANDVWTEFRLCDWEAQRHISRTQCAETARPS